MYTRKRGIALLMALIMCFTLLNGCGSKNTSQNAPSSSQANVPSDMNAVGFPIVKEPVTLKFAVSKGAQQGNYKDMLVWNEYEKKTNIHIEWDEIPQAQINEKRNLILSTGDLPDAFLKCAIPDKDLLTYGSQGTFVGMIGLMDKYAPNFKKVMADYPSVKSGMTLADGNIYSFPYLFDSLPVKVGKLYINTKWLTKVGKQMPKTTEELYTVLRAFKEKDPNGNGQADEVPLTNAALNGVLEVMKGAWGLANKGNKNVNIDLDEKTGKIRFYPIDPNYRDMLQYMNRLYKEDLLDHDVMTLTTPQFITKTSQNIVGAHPNLPTNVGPAYQEDFAGLDTALKGPNGDQMWTSVNSFIGQKGAFAITNTNKHPEATMRWVDYFYSDEGMRLFFMGIEGVTYKVTADGKYEYTDEITKNPNGLTLDQAAGKYVPYSGGVNPSIVTDKYFKGAEMFHTSIEGTKKLEPYLIKEVWEGFNLTQDEYDRTSALGNDINNYVNQMTSQFISGKASFSDWDNYVNTIKKMGLDDFVKIYNDAYERYKKK